MFRTIEQELYQNYDAFRVQLPRLLLTHQGKFALLHTGEIVEFFDTARDAYVAGCLLFSVDNLFSLQEVVDGPYLYGAFLRYRFALPRG